MYSSMYYQITPAVESAYYSVGTSRHNSTRLDEVKESAESFLR